ncbi:MAG: cell division protein FtsH, partial [Rhizobiaceae bacterium]|nr:cell division protein FtsH [Rhizobiaceae bacterium]
AKRILTKYKKEWIAIAEGLLEYETLTGDEIKQLIAGQKPSRDLGDDTPPSRGSAVPKAGAGGRRKKGGEEPEGGMEPQPQG